MNFQNDTFMKKEYRFYLSVSNQKTYILLADWWLESIEQAENFARGMVTGAHVKYKHPLIEIKEVLNTESEILISSIY